MLHAYILQTERLILRSPTMEDVPRISLLLNDYEVSKSTLNIPHPYTEQDARDWLLRMKDKAEAGEPLYHFAIIHQEENLLIGSIAIGIKPRHRCGDLAYWLGKSYWGKGYTTEAARSIIRFGYEAHNLTRIGSGHYTDNPASGRVMQKCGMTHEGTFRKFMERDGVLHDVAYYSILRDEWEAQQR